jgi:hypothetical protein
MRPISSPAGQAALQGAVFSSKRGLRKRQDPVLLPSLVRVERDMNKESAFALFK